HRKQGAPTMSSSSRKTSLYLFGALCLLALLSGLSPARAQLVSLPAFNADISQTSVSGLSSGATWPSSSTSISPRRGRQHLTDGPERSWQMAPECEYLAPSISSNCIQEGQANSHNLTD